MRLPPWRDQKEIGSDLQYPDTIRQLGGSIGVAPSAPILEPVVPARYSDESKLIIDVKGDDESLDFTLESS